MSTPIVGTSARAPKLSTAASGSMARVEATPNVRRMRAVRKIWQPSVNTFTSRSICAKNTVRAPRSVKASAAMVACWK